MATITDIKNFVASYLHRTTVNDLNPLNLSPAGINVDLGMLAINSASKYAQKMHDFKACEVNVFLSVPSTGGSLSACYATSALTGTAIGVKRIDSVLLPLTGGEYVPVEFMTNDAFVSRVRRAIGRHPWEATKTLADLGFSPSNPLSYLNGTTLFLYPITTTLTVQMNVTRWLVDYAAGGDTDFFTQIGNDFLQWQSVLEVNKLLRVFAPKQEGNVDEEAIKLMADSALSALIEYDKSTALGTSTPNAQAGPTS